MDVFDQLRERNARLAEAPTALSVFNTDETALAAARVVYAALGGLTMEQAECALYAAQQAVRLGAVVEYTSPVALVRPTPPGDLPLGEWINGLTATETEALQALRPLIVAAVQRG